MLTVSSCPKLLSLPPVPWTSCMCSVEISKVGFHIAKLRYGKDNFDNNVLSLKITGNDHAQDMTAAAFWTVLDFDKLTGLERLVMVRCPSFPLDGLQKLPSTVKILDISRGDMFSGKELSQMLSCMPHLSELLICQCVKITGLCVAEQLKEVTCSSSRIEEEEEEEGLLVLPPQLQSLLFSDCPEISLCPDSPHGENGGGLQGLTSLRTMSISNCPKFFARYLSSSSSACFPLPTSLQSLELMFVETLPPLSNLDSLTALSIIRCGCSEGVGLPRLLAHGCLRDLHVRNTPNFFSIASKNSPQMLEQALSFPSSKLQSLTTDDVAGVFTEPICKLLSSFLTSLVLYHSNQEMERFTKEQDEALQLLTSLQRLDLPSYGKLQCLPAGLEKLTNLKTLAIPDSSVIHSLPKGSFPDSLQELEIRGRDIRSLPKDTLPNSLQKLTISGCSALRSLPKGILPDSLQELEIECCPSIRRLPKGGLPSSLQVLSCFFNSEELTRQCRKLRGTIPIVRA